jgi:hypothetical protein
MQFHVGEFYEEKMSRHQIFVCVEESWRTLYINTCALRSHLERKAPIIYCGGRRFEKELGSRTRLYRTNCFCVQCETLLQTVTCIVRGVAYTQPVPRWIVTRLLGCNKSSDCLEHLVSLPGIWITFCSLLYS